MAKTPFAICRIEKRSDISQIRRSQKHNLRQQATPNARPDGPPPAVLFGSPDLVATVRSMLPEKRRKNAVLAVEMVLTASPEWWHKSSPEEHQQWLDSNLQWLGSTYGENLAQVVFHADEATPHLHAYWVPLVDGRLNYRELYGTPRKMISLQDSYAAAMAPLGLARGKPRSARRHEHHSKVVDLWTQAQSSMKHTAKILRELASMIDNLDSAALLQQAGNALSLGLGIPQPSRAESSKDSTGRSLKEVAPALPQLPSCPMTSPRP